MIFRLMKEENDKFHVWKLVEYFLCWLKRVNYSVACFKFSSQFIHISKDDLAFVVQQNYGTYQRQILPQGKLGRILIIAFCKQTNFRFNKKNRQAYERFISANSEAIKT